MAEQNYIEAIYENLVDFTTGGKFVLGKFKPEHKLMIKIIHFNISPTWFKKELKLTNAE